MQDMTKRDLSTVPAVREWAIEEARAKEEARDWARTRLEAIVSQDAEYKPRTAGEFLAVLDHDPAQPSAWARINKGETVSYNTRFQIVRNNLESMARAKTVSCGTTVNSKGKEHSTTYARPRDVTAEWAIEVDGRGVGSQQLANDLKEFLSSRGYPLEHIEGAMLTRKSSTGGTTSNDGHGQTAAKPGTKIKRRKPRSTRGGD
jgi:hypothetical protein